MAHKNKVSPNSVNIRRENIVKVSSHSKKEFENYDKCGLNNNNNYYTTSDQQQIQEYHEQLAHNNKPHQLQQQNLQNTSQVQRHQLHYNHCQEQYIDDQEEREQHQLISQQQQQQQQQQPHQQQQQQQQQHQQQHSYQQQYDNQEQLQEERKYQTLNQDNNGNCQLYDLDLDLDQQDGQNNCDTNLDSQSDQSVYSESQVELRSQTSPIPHYQQTTLEQQQQQQHSNDLIQNPFISSDYNHLLNEEQLSVDQYQQQQQQQQQQQHQQQQQQHQQQQQQQQQCHSEDSNYQSESDNSIEDIQDIDDCCQQSNNQQELPYQYINEQVQNTLCEYEDMMPEISSDSQLDDEGNTIVESEIAVHRQNEPQRQLRCQEVNDEGSVDTSYTEYDNEYRVQNNDQGNNTYWQTPIQPMCNAKEEYYAKINNAQNLTNIYHRESFQNYSNDYSDSELLQSISSRQNFKKLSHDEDDDDASSIPISYMYQQGRASCVDSEITKSPKICGNQKIIEPVLQINDAATCRELFEKLISESENTSNNSVMQIDPDYEKCMPMINLESDSDDEFIKFKFQDEQNKLNNSLKTKNINTENRRIESDSPPSIISIEHGQQIVNYPKSPLCKSKKIKKRKNKLKNICNKEIIKNHSNDLQIINHKQLEETCKMSLLLKESNICNKENVFKENIEEANHSIEKCDINNETHEINKVENTTNSIESIITMDSDEDLCKSIENNESIICKKESREMIDIHEEKVIEIDDKYVKRNNEECEDISKDIEINEIGKEENIVICKDNNECDEINESINDIKEINNIDTKNKSGENNISKEYILLEKNTKKIDEDLRKQISNEHKLVGGKSLFSCDSISVEDENIKYKNNIDDRIKDSMYSTSFMIKEIKKKLNGISNDVNNYKIPSIIENKQNEVNDCNNKEIRGTLAQQIQMCFKKNNKANFNSQSKLNITNLNISCNKDNEIQNDRVVQNENIYSESFKNNTPNYRYHSHNLNNSSHFKINNEIKKDGVVHYDDHNRSELFKEMLNEKNSQMQDEQASEISARIRARELRKQNGNFDTSSDYQRELFIKSISKSNEENEEKYDSYKTFQRLNSHFLNSFNSSMHSIESNIKINNEVSSNLLYPRKNSEFNFQANLKKTNLESSVKRKTIDKKATTVRESLEMQSMRQKRESYSQSNNVGPQYAHSLPSYKSESPKTKCLYEKLNRCKDELPNIVDYNSYMKSLSVINDMKIKHDNEKGNKLNMKLSKLTTSKNDHKRKREKMDNDIEKPKKISRSLSKSKVKNKEKKIQPKILLCKNKNADNYIFMPKSEVEKRKKHIQRRNKNPKK